MNVFKTVISFYCSPCLGACDPKSVQTYFVNCLSWFEGVSLPLGDGQTDRRARMLSLARLNEPGCVSTKDTGLLGRCFIWAARSVLYWAAWSVLYCAARSVHYWAARSVLY